MNTPFDISLKKISDNAIVPFYATKLSAGCDLCACIDESIALLPLQRILVPTGLSIALPKGYEAQVRPRSGLALKNGITVLNSPGTIDADYRGEIKVILINLSDQSFEITHGMRIAQMIIAKHETVSFIVKESLDETEREAGFGSTGLFVA